MVFFLIKKIAHYTLDGYLKGWAPDLADEVRVLLYEDLADHGRLLPGTYVFCDQERWTPRQKGLAIELWDQLACAGLSFVLLNDPRQVLLRYELLRRLHDIGQNSFNIYRLPGALLEAEHFPVFLHSTHNHHGACSPLLPNRAALLSWTLRKLHRWNTTLVEEFCDVASSGIYTKFGAFNMGGEIVPRHLFFGKNWCLKDTELMDDEKIRIFGDYLRDNPHAQKVAEIFKLARIDYGRIDYAFHGDQMQVWEINTNPIVMDFADDILKEELPLGEVFNALIKPHFRRLAALHKEGAPIPYRLSGSFNG